MDPAMIGVVVFLAAAVAVWVMFGAARTPPSEQVTDALKRGATILDVRTPGEYRAGHVTGALNVPVDEVGVRLSEVPQDRPVLVYCASGNRSRRATGILRQAGREAIDAGTMRSFPPELRQG